MRPEPTAITTPEETKPTAWAWLPVAVWVCPRCQEVVMSREAGVRCPRCLLVEGT